jgi:tripartite-type tricarboxylate transporter receptor subunit TctC
MVRNHNMRLSRSQFLQFVGVGLASPLLSGLAWTQDWPARPIRSIVPYIAGTGVDIIGRLVLTELATQLDQTIIVENRPGASATIGAAMVAKAAADGCTILVDSSSHTVAPAMVSNLSYDPALDLSAITPLAATPLVLVVAASKGIRTVSDLFSLGKARPGSLNFGSPGSGSITHLATQRLRLAAGIEAVHVPFRGGGFITEVLAGRIMFAYSPIGSVIDLIQSGQLHALVVASRHRTPVLPDVPTTLEAGYPDADVNLWIGIFVPAKTPGHVVERLNQEVTNVLRTPSMQEKLAQIGAEPMIMAAAAFDAMVKKEFAANAALVKSMGLTSN